MKKSFFYRILQVALAIALGSMMSVWAYTSHDEFVFSLLSEIDSLIVILVIAVALPYFCFKVLGKLYTPPVSRDVSKSSKVNQTGSNLDTSEAITQDVSLMRYRGIVYQPEEVKLNLDNSGGVSKSEDLKTSTVIKYRGVSIETGDKEQNNAETGDTFETERRSQKSAKPKERIKYRGSYVD
ncbi:hypothetical protein HCU40_13635 [Pseudanabaena biceps]|nr:hypothetical protein [Pseudanabaena biceps]